MSGARCKEIIDNLATIAAAAIYYQHQPQQSGLLESHEQVAPADLQLICMKCMCLGPTTALVGSSSGAYVVQQDDVDKISVACAGVVAAFKTRARATIHAAAVAFGAAVDQLLTEYGYPPAGAGT
jgi:hypothetical protein